MRTTTLLLVSAASLVSCQYGQGGQGGAYEAELRRRQQELEEAKAAAKRGEADVTALRAQTETLTADLTTAQQKSAACVIA